MEMELQGGEEKGEVEDLPVPYMLGVAKSVVVELHKSLVLFGASGKDSLVVEEQVH